MKTVKERIKESVGKEIKIYLKNGFRFYGKLTNADDIFVELLDYKTNSFKIIGYGEISNLEIITPSATSQQDAVAKDAVILGNHSNNKNGVRGVEKDATYPHDKKEESNNGL